MMAAEQRFSEAPDSALGLSTMPWGYYWYLGGGLSTMGTQPANLAARNRAASIVRIAAINGVIDRLVGADKANMSVVDFACNWGGMAIDMGLRGFRAVSAFDFKPDNVERASKLGRYMKAHNVNFSVENVYNLPRRYGSFDVVLNLGLMYHVTDPVELVKITYGLTRHVAVFDTLAHKEPFSGYVQAYISDKQIKRSGMGAHQIELHPTYRGMIDLIQFAGFKDLTEVVPVLGEDFPERDLDPYFQGYRRTIVAFK